MNVNIDKITLENLRRTKALRDSDFFQVYRKLAIGAPLETDELSLLLRAALLFLRNDDSRVNQLGYSILISFTLATDEFAPLAHVAYVKEFTPLYTGLNTWRAEAQLSPLAETLIDIAAGNFRHTAGEYYLTGGQARMHAAAEVAATAAFIAPTSYGKSELLMGRALSRPADFVVVLVPTRTLIAQVRAGFRATKPTGTHRIITHNDAYIGNRKTLAILTQERLGRLLTDNPDARVDHLLVDEAHNIFEDGGRGTELARVIAVCRKRNPNLDISFFSPFISTALSLNDIISPVNADEIRVDEHIKVERYQWADLNDGLLKVYDQFFGQSFETHVTLPNDELEAVKRLAGSKNLIYAGKPRVAEELSLKLKATLPMIDSDLVKEAAEAIEELTDPDYSLVDALRHGVIFHHGKVPDSIRGYIESSFANRDSGVRYVLCTSTLLEGVNTPADRLFILTPRRGRKNLSVSAFRNLAGRVGRFGEVFAQRDISLVAGLRPSVVIFKGATAPDNFNVQSFLDNHADLRREAVDSVENPLLEWSDSGQDARERELERLENIEGGTVLSTPIRIASTDVGRLMFTWGVADFDIIDNEKVIADRLLGTYDIPGNQLRSSAEVIGAIVAVFLESIQDDNDALSRLRLYDEARSFYGMLLDWRRATFPLKRMIRSFLRYWEDSSDPLIWVGPSWGDERRSAEEHQTSYVRKASKTRSQLVNLAIARIKDEGDFLSFRLMRYIEVLNDLGYVSTTTYAEIRYGTSDAWMIRLIRSGLSVELVRLLRNEYREFVRVDSDAGDFELTEELINAMETRRENPVLLFEARSWVIG